jgi:large subunit ribosomal protein L10
MAKVAQWKLEAVRELKDMLLEYPVVGVVDMAGIPAKQLQKIRGLLRGEAIIKMSRKSVMRHALKKAATEEKSLVSLEDHIRGQPAFIFSRINPFKLNKILLKNRAMAPAKPNSIAPNDIIIQKGDTPFPPGPLLGEMQQVGIPATISGGKITVKEDKVVVSKGEKINPKLAEILGRLGIEPMELSLRLEAAYEDGVVFPSDLLTFDVDAMVSDLQEAHRQAVNLSMNSGFITTATAQLTLTKAILSARALAREAGIYEKEVMDQILAGAHAKAIALERVIKEPFETKLKEVAKGKQAAEEKVTTHEAYSEGGGNTSEDTGSDLTNIKGLGEKRAEQLRGAGVTTIEDLLKAPLEEISEKTGIQLKDLAKYVADAKKRR